jgi:hypothetical protein
VRPAVRRGRALAGLLALALLACSCRAGPKEARRLPAHVGPPTFLVQAADARGTILLGTPRGVYRTLDAGASWGTTPRRIWNALSAGYTAGSTIVSRGRLFVRGNLTFDHVGPARRAPFSGGSAVSLAWLPGGKLYALVRRGHARLYVTLDSARSWWPRPAIGLPGSARQLAVQRVDGRPDVVYAAAGGDGLWRSLDGGVTFSRVPAAGRDVVAVTTGPAHRGRVLVATPRVRVSEDYGETWRSTGFRARLLASDPRNGDVFFAVSSDGLLQASSDGGLTW